MRSGRTDVSNNLFVKCLPIAHFWGLWRFRLAMPCGAVSLRLGGRAGDIWPTYKADARARERGWMGGFGAFGMRLEGREGLAPVMTCRRAWP